MIRRRDLFKMAVAVPAAIIGSKLAGTPTVGKPAVEGTITMTHTVPELPRTVRVHTREIDHLDKIKINGRALSWTTDRVNYVPEVGVTLQIERDFKESWEIERFRVIVMEHEEL